MRNIPTVHPIFVDQLNTYDVITSQYVVFTKEAFELRGCQDRAEGGLI